MYIDVYDSSPLFCAVPHDPREPPVAPRLPDPPVPDDLMADSNHRSRRAQRSERAEALCQLFRGGDPVWDDMVLQLCEDDPGLAAFFERAAELLKAKRQQIERITGAPLE
jgi:hypothetical protein